MVAAFILGTKQSIIFLQKSNNIQHSGQLIRRNILSFIEAQYLESKQEHLVTEIALCHINDKYAVDTPDIQCISEELGPVR